MNNNPNIKRINSLSYNHSASKFPVLNIIQKLDQFGPLVDVRQYSKNRHRTYLGAFCTVGVYAFCVLLVVYCVLFFDYQS